MAFKLGDFKLDDLIKTGVNLWSEDQQRAAERDTAASAIELEKLRIEQLRREAELEKQKGSTVSGRGLTTVKVVAIAGGLIIVGIATYFFFKKKKIS